MIFFDKPERLVDRVFLHCSASDTEYRADELYEFIRQIHVEQNCWSDIGYHFMIDKQGTIMRGREIARIPAAQAPHNHGTIAIMLHGLDFQKFTSAQFDALRMLCNEINDAYQGRITFHGHCEVNKHKTCPVFNYKQILNLDRFGRMP